MWFSSVWPFFPECIKTSFFLFFLLPQVDYKSYLLDFKSLPLKDEADEDGGSGGVTEDSGTTLTNFFPHSFPLHLCQEELIHLFFSGAVVKEKEAEVENQMPGGHHTMEFFEMCAALITQLAR